MTTNSADRWPENVSLNETPCPFVMPPWREGEKPSASTQCFACGQRLWQHEAPARTEIVRALLSLLVVGVICALVMVVG